MLLCFFLRAEESKNKKALLELFSGDFEPLDRGGFKAE